MPSVLFHMYNKKRTNIPFLHKNLISLFIVYLHRALMGFDIILIEFLRKGRPHLIAVNNVTKSYGDLTALSGVSFRIDEGESIGIFGLQGAGKTTLCDVLTGYLSCTSGTIEVDGLDMERYASKGKGTLAYLPKNMPLYIDMSVMQYLEFISGLNKVPKRQQKANIEAALRFTNLLAEKDATIATLSLLERRFVSIAGALSYLPKVLVFDQPFTSLTTQDAITLRSLLSALTGSFSIVLCSDVVSDITEICKRAIVLNHGKVMTDSSLDQLLSFSGQRNRLRIKILGNVAAIKDAFSDIYEIVELTFQNAPEQGAVDVFIDAAQGVDLRQAIWQSATTAQLPILEMRYITISVEDVFLQLTSRTDGGL